MVKATGDMIDDPHCGWIFLHTKSIGENPIDVVKVIHNCDYQLFQKRAR